eukprot:TRINITY_DN12055_c0_g1_i2.p1 TRINITY_DN12055_c0_g1~~TRINITY_DN12055_c0_g1_i2.p1  ORF type:complete len:241 (+),score=22.04 TRINITY_DN12055_c0_g1_i2:107-829(+)
MFIKQQLESVNGNSNISNVCQDLTEQHKREGDGVGDQIIDKNYQNSQTTTPTTDFHENQQKDIRDKVLSYNQSNRSSKDEQVSLNNNAVSTIQTMKQKQSKKGNIQQHGLIDEQNVVPGNNTDNFSVDQKEQCNLLPDQEKIQNDLNNKIPQGQIDDQRKVEVTLPISQSTEKMSNEQVRLSSTSAEMKNNMSVQDGTGKQKKDSINDREVLTPRKQNRQHARLFLSSHPLDFAKKTQRK